MDGEFRDDEAYARGRDEDDALAPFRERFHLPTGPDGAPLPGGVAEQHGRAAIIPIHKTGQQLGANDEDVPVGAAADKADVLALLAGHRQYIFFSS